ncbi:hypothetical protein BB560_006204, partial [Smittium megazygosporum]
THAPNKTRNGSHINIRTSDLRERAYFKYPTLRTWISDLVKQPIRSQTSTWVTGTARWMKRYCQTVGRGNTVKALQHRYTVNDKTKISAWIKAHNMRNTGSWMDLQMRHPDIKLGLQDIGKIRMGCYWTAQRLAKAGLIPKMYIERCPFCNKNTPETIEHMLVECFRWNSIRHETTVFNIPRLYRTVTIDQSTNNQALNQGRNIMLDSFKMNPNSLEPIPVVYGVPGGWRGTGTNLYGNDKRKKSFRKKNTRLQDHNISPSINFLKGLIMVRSSMLSSGVGYLVIFDDGLNKFLDKRVLN